MSTFRMQRRTTPLTVECDMVGPLAVYFYAGAWCIAHARLGRRLPLGDLDGMPLEYEDVMRVAVALVEVLEWLKEIAPVIDEHRAEAYFALIRSLAKRHKVNGETNVHAA